MPISFKTEKGTRRIHSLNKVIKIKFCGKNGSQFCTYINVCKAASPIPGQLKKSILVGWCDASNTNDANGSLSGIVRLYNDALINSMENLGTASSLV